MLRNSLITEHKGTYCRLVEPTNEQGKEDMFLAGINRYTAQQSKFSILPGTSVAYWTSSAVFKLFQCAVPVRKYGRSLQGTVTGDNERFMRLWHEVDSRKLICNAFNAEATKEFKWIPYCKGGEFRRWYGNIVHIINWENDGFEIRNFRDSNGKLRSRPQNVNAFFKEAIT